MISVDRNYSIPFARVKAQSTTALVWLTFSLNIGVVHADVPVGDDARLRPETQKAADTDKSKTSADQRNKSTGGLKCSVSRKASTGAIRRAADNNGIPAQFLENAAVVESRCNPNARAPGSSAGGLGQFIDSTWRRYGNGADKFDPDANADAMARLTKDDVAGLEKKLGRTPTFEEAYLAHQQGLGGASCLLRNPNGAATSCVSSSAVTGNGGTTGMTAGQFSALVEGYYNTGSLPGARGVLANYNATGQTPSSGDFAGGGNGTGPDNPSSFPPLKTTTTRAASLGDQTQTSDTATAYSGDLLATQKANLTMLGRRSAAIGSSDSTQDAMDVNSRMRADHIQLWQGGIDAVNTWNSVLTASIVNATTIQSNTAKALHFTGAPTSSVMPGIPSVVPSQGGSGAISCGTPTFGQSCGAPVADNAANVSSFLATIAASISPISSAQAATAPVASPAVPADLAAFQTSSK